MQARLVPSPAQEERRRAPLLTDRTLDHPDAVGDAVELEVAAQVGNRARVRLERDHGRAAPGRQRGEVPEMGSDVEHHAAIPHRLGERSRGRALAILLLKLWHVVRMQGGVAAEHNSADLLGELPKSAQRRRASAVDEPAEAEAAQYGGRALKQTQER